MEYTRAEAFQASTVARLALLLWSGNTLENLIAEYGEVLADENSAVFVAIDDNTEIAFAQFGLRHDYVEGTDRRPVGYVEGIYVLESRRGEGVAKKLVALGEAWAREKGCAQMASDCELDNTGSLRFHLGCGFTEANRIICFVKDIG